MRKYVVIIKIHRKAVDMGRVFTYYLITGALMWSIFYPGGSITNASYISSAQRSMTVFIATNLLRRQSGATLCGDEIPYSRPALYMVGWGRGEKSLH